jgi:sugar/nucleoside kinase (ribokinase family)
VAVVPGLVHVAGNAALDMLVRDVSALDVPAEDAWGANVQLLSRPIEAALGGCGAAPAYVLGHLGQRVVLNSNIGDDAWGQMLTGWLVGAGVECAKNIDAATAAHVIALQPDGRRRSFYYAGSRVDWSRSLVGETPEWFLASGYGKVQLADLRELHRVCGELRQRGAQVLFDSSPWFAGRVEVADMHALWAQVDCLSATEDELAAWVKGPDCAALAEEVLLHGVAKVVVKRGGQGAFYADRDGRRGKVEVESVAAANTVGAGDSFNGRLVFGLCRGEVLETAVNEAAALATRVVRGGRGVLGMDG